MLQDSQGEKIRISKWIGHQDNNVAEYVALLEALQHALKLKAKVLHVFSDSQVVVRQMTGEYACRSPRLYSLHWTCRKLARSFDFAISHISRESNRDRSGGRCGRGAGLRAGAGARLPAAGRCRTQSE